METKVGKHLFIGSYRKTSSYCVYELCDDEDCENTVATINVYFYSDRRQVILESVDLIETEKVKDVYDFMFELEKEEN